MADFGSRRSLQDTINIQPWHQISFQQKAGSEYIVKYLFDKIRCNYEIIIYDGTKLYYEQLDGDEKFDKKCKVFNPNIEASAFSMIEELSKSFEECLKTSKLDLQTEDYKIQIHMKSKLKAGIPFKWIFVFQEAPQDFVWKHVVQPLTIISNELYRRQQELSYMLERKDREIQDYKDQGTSVSRKHLETPYFDRPEYQRTSTANQAFLDFCSRPSLKSLTDNLSDIYQKTMFNMQSKKTSEGAQLADPGPSATFDTVPIIGRVSQSWDNEKRLGNASFAQDQLGGCYGDSSGGGQAEQNQAIEASAVSVVTEALSPEEEEKKRREELRKRLNVETDKNSKKKKRKLNI